MASVRCQRPSARRGRPWTARQRDMPVKKRPTPQHAVTASQILLDGLAHDAGIPELLNQLAPLHPRNNTFPGDVFLRRAADTLDWSGASRADPVTLEGMRERLLPECAFRGRDTRKLQFAVLAAAAQRGGAPLRGRLVADRRLLAVRHVRSGCLHPIAADRAGVPVPQVCRA